MVEIEFLERFESKKNRVYRARINGEKRVLKIFSSLEAFDKEYHLLDLLKDRVSVPRVYDVNRGSRIIIMELIEGENLCDLLNYNIESNIHDDIEIIEELARWFSDFHLILRDEHMIRGDSILRNFIVDHKGRIYGVDFEESREGRVEEDIAEICISILTTHPMFIDEKFELCKRFINSYSGDINVSAFRSQMVKILERSSIRRKDLSLKDAGIKEMKKHGLI